MHGGANQPRVGVEERRLHRAHPRNAQREPHIELTDEEYAALTAALNKIEIHGDRDGKDIAKLGTVPDNVDR